MQLFTNMGDFSIGGMWTSQPGYADTNSKSGAKDPEYAPHGVNRSALTYHEHITKSQVTSVVLGTCRDGVHVEVKAAT